MSQHPDKLFRDKLQYYRAEPPATAWLRIEAHLQQTRRKVYWRVAAALAMLMVAALYALKWYHTGSEKPGLTRTHETLQVMPHTGNPPAPPSSNKAPVNEVARPQVKRPVARKPVPVASQTSEADTPPAADATNGLSANLAAVQPDAASGKKVVISLAEARQFLKPGEGLRATPEPKKSSRLQRFVELASIIVAEDDMMGQLRERKDELLVRHMRTTHERQN